MAMMTCPKCGQKMQVGGTCPNCGYTDKGSGKSKPPMKGKAPAKKAPAKGTFPPKKSGFPYGG